MLIDGRKIATEILKKLKKRVEKLRAKGIIPKLAVILVGADRPSQTYVRKKSEAATAVGIEFVLHQLPARITRKKIIEKINEIQTDARLSGLIVQLPLPEPLFTDEVLNAIRPEYDVDCLTDANLGRLVKGDDTILPPTPGAVMAILENLGVPVSGKNVTILGTGALVGKPLAIILMNMGASVTTCNSRTVDTKQKCLQADILISAVGKKDLVRGEMIKEGAIVIDSGVDFVHNQMFGDVNFEEAVVKAGFVTPTPGGVGPITVARLLWNTVLCAEKNAKL
ncbi:MAG: bifunctional 5,10-methylenetetrahydrofolate dehydrogenase/5,10-methenyltetrahydrofolate cyclohydrolase [Patescibacteria group bacterium]